METDVRRLVREGYDTLLVRIASWLRLGGILVMNAGTSDNAGEIEEWIDGVPMFFNSWDTATNTALIAGAGFELLVDEVREQLEDPGTAVEELVRFQWLMARRGDPWPAAN